MKVLHVITSIASFYGGPSQVVLEMVKALRDCGVEAEIVTTNNNGPDVLAVPLCQRTEYNQVPVWFFPRFSPAVGFLRTFTFSYLLTTWLRQHTDEYDLVHVHGLFTYPTSVAMLTAYNRQIPYIVSPHGSLCSWSLQQSTLRKQLYLALTERRNLDQAQALVFATLQEQQDTASLSLKSADYTVPFGLSVPTPIPDARRRLRQLLQVDDNEPVILFMSRLHYKKGLDYLIPALGKIAQERFTFVLAGSGDREYELEIETLLQTAGIRQRTYLPGFVAGEIKDLLLQGSDLFALTSHSENFGVVVLEALAAGVPVLITPGVALAAVVKQYQGGYITELDMAAIASAVQHFLQHPQLAIEMGKRGRQLVLEQYTWESTATKMIEVYTAILQKDLKHCGVF